MHKYLCALLLATCTTTVMAADDSKIPSSPRVLKRAENFSVEDLDASPIVVEARQETQVMEKVKQLTILNNNPIVLAASAAAYAGANNDTAALLTSEQIRTLITTAVEIRGKDIPPMCKMTDVLDLDGKVVYDSARYLGNDSYAQPVLKALTEFSNIVAYRISYQPNKVEGTEAKPTMMAKYDIYEVPPFLATLLKESVMARHLFPMLIEEHKLKPLTFSDAQAILTSKKKHLQTFEYAKRDYSMGLNVKLRVEVRYHTSEENVTQNEEFLANYFKGSVQENLKFFEIKPPKTKKTKSPKTEETQPPKAKKIKRSKPKTTPDQVSSSDQATSSSK